MSMSEPFLPAHEPSRDPDPRDHDIDTDVDVFPEPRPGTPRHSARVHGAHRADGAAAEPGASTDDIAESNATGSNTTERNTTTAAAAAQHDTTPGTAAEGDPVHPDAPRPPFRTPTPGDTLTPQQLTDELAAEPHRHRDDNEPSPSDAES